MRECAILPQEIDARMGSISANRQLAGGKSTLDGMGPEEIDLNVLTEMF